MEYIKKDPKYLVSKINTKTVEQNGKVKKLKHISYLSKNQKGSSTSYGEKFEVGIKWIDNFQSAFTYKTKEDAQELCDRLNKVYELLKLKDRSTRLEVAEINYVIQEMDWELKE